MPTLYRGPHQVLKATGAPEYGQASNMPKFNHEKHEICLVPKMTCVTCNEQQLFQASNVPGSLMTNMNIFEHQ